MRAQHHPTILYIILCKRSLYPLKLPFHAFSSLLLYPHLPNDVLLYSPLIIRKQLESHSHALPTSKLQPINNLYEMSLMLSKTPITSHAMDPIQSHLFKGFVPVLTLAHLSLQLLPLKWTSSNTI